MAANPPHDHRRRLESLLGVPFTEGNAVVRLKNGQQIFPAMLDAIAAAERSIEFLTFVYWEGDIARRMAEALAESARRGVGVRVLLDAVGCARMDDDLVRQMRDAGVTIERFRTPSWRFWESWHRTHRKVLVCDGRVGFTGGVGIARQWEGDARNPDEWRESHFRIEGPAVDGLRSAFFGNWIESQDLDEDDLEAPTHSRSGPSAVQVVRSTASYSWSDAAMILRACLLTARRSIRLTTAYFVPDERSAQDLIDAARRGVDVAVLVPGPHSDQRLCRLAGQDVYRPLLDAGVRIHSYQRTMLHAKVLTVDGVLAGLGSCNFNQRSMSQDDEVCVQVLDTELVTTLDQDFEQDLEHSEALDLGSWKRRGRFQRLGEFAARALRRQL